MKASSPILASILAASVLLVGAPTASASGAPEPICQEIYYGLEQFLIVCVDADPSCTVKIVNQSGSTCYGVTMHVGVIERCVPLANDLEYEYGVCVDSDRAGCRAWTYRGNSQNCLVP